MDEIRVALPAQTRDTGDFTQRASDLCITDDSMEKVGRSILSKLIEFKKLIKDDFEPTRKALDTAKKKVLEQRNKYLAPIESAEQMTRNKLTAYANERERREREERERQQIEARKIQEAKRVEELEALEAFRKKETDALRSQGLIDKAQAIEDFAKQESEALLAQAIEDPEPYIAPAPAHRGLTTVYDANVVDIVLFYRHIAENPALGQMFAPPNVGELKRFARTHKSDAKFPGVKFSTSKKARL